MTSYGGLPSAQCQPTTERQPYVFEKRKMLGVGSREGGVMGISLLPC